MEPRSIGDYLRYFFTLKQIEVRENIDNNKMLDLKPYHPSSKDKQWLINCLKTIGRGNLWITDQAMFRLMGDTLHCVNSINAVAPNANMDTVTIESNIRKVKTIARCIGLKFVDDRQSTSN